MTAGNDQPTTLAPAPDVDGDRVTAGESPGSGNLEKVRDILFGTQMRELDRRFARLEERIVKETQDLKDDIRRRLDALEAYTTKETEALAGHIRQERTDRVDANARLA